MMSPPCKLLWTQLCCAAVGPEPVPVHEAELMYRTVVKQDFSSELGPEEPHPTKKTQCCEATLSEEVGYDTELAEKVAAVDVSKW